MANAVLTPTIILKEMLHRFENNIQMAGLVYRSLEEAFNQNVNGHKVGSSVTISRPVQYTVRSGAVAAIQDITEGSTTVTVGSQYGIDFKFSSSDMTLSISDFSRKYIEPAAIRLANQVDTDLLSLYKDVPNWVGTPGQVINSYVDFAKGPERLDLIACPSDNRSAAFSPTDQWGLLGNISQAYIQDTAKSALERAKLPMLGGVDIYGMQNVQTHTVGPITTGTPLVDGAGQANTYASVKTTMIGSLLTKGWTNSTPILNVGDVFTLAGVYDVNPVTKATLPHLKNFVVTTATTTSGGGAMTIAYYPAMISSGAYQNISAAVADSVAVTVFGTQATGYAANLIFHKNAFALISVPLEKPQGAVDVQQVTQNGVSLRLIPYYDGTNDVSSWRLDLLMGKKTLNPELAVRVSGTA